jgi:hypothetical protein
VRVERVEGGCSVDACLPELQCESQVLHLVEEEEIVKELLMVVVWLALRVYAELAQYGYYIDSHIIGFLFLIIIIISL